MAYGIIGGRWTRRKVLVAGMIAAALACAYPPWIVEADLKGVPLVKPQRVYAFVFDPPEPDSVLALRTVGAYGFVDNRRYGRVDLDLGRLVLTLSAIALATAAACVYAPRERD